MRDSTRCLACILSLVLALSLGLAVERSAWQAEGSTFQVQPTNAAQAFSQPTATSLQPRSSPPVPGTGERRDSATPDSGTANGPLTFTLTAWPQVASRYGMLIYTLSLTNTGATSLTGLTITARLPEGLFYLPHPSVGDGRYDAEGGRVIWEVPSCLPAQLTSPGLEGPEGACFWAAFQVGVMENASELMEVEARVEARGETLTRAGARVAVEGWVEPIAPTPTSTPVAFPSPTPTATPFVFLTPTASPAVTPPPGASPSPTPTLVAPARFGLAFSLAVWPTEVFPGDLLTYTLALTNTGEAVLRGLTVSDTLPDGLIYLPGSATAGQFDPRTRQFVWQISALASDTQQASFQARVRGDVRDDLIVNQVEVRGESLAHPLQAGATLAVMRQAAIMPEGGVLETPSGRVRAEFPAGAVSRPVHVTYRPLDVRRLPPGQTGLALQFELTARPVNAGATAPPITQFQQRLRLTVDLTGLVDEAALGPYKRLFVGYLDESTGRWVHLPVVEQQIGPVLTVEVDHLSVFGVGADGVMEWGWSPTFNDAQVSLFNGGFTYNYPIEVPAGRGGLQPNLNLSYNSRRVDGILTWIQTDWVGLGWSIDTVEIVRQGVQRCWEDNWICYKNEFLLVLNGTAYELKPAVQAQDYGRYHTEDESFLYIERRNAAGGNGSSQNTTSEYWIVRTKDGIAYELGYTADSEQVFGPYAKSNGQPAFGYVGIHPALAAFRWQVKRVTDLHGNQLVYHYFEETRDQQCNAEGDDCWGSLSGDSERASYLDRIEYNHRDDGQPGVKVIFQRALRDSGSDPVDDRWNDTIAGGQWPGIPLAVFWQRYYLQGIEVMAWQGPGSEDFTPVRQYVFTYDDFIPADEENKHLRTLDDLQVRARQGADWVELPLTTFDYEGYRNKGWCSSGTDWQRAQFYYPRLSEINNGYGGIIIATYESPEDEENYWCEYERNYRVSHRETKDRGTVVSQVDYTYPPGLEGRCYEAEGSCNATGGELVGYQWITETLKAGSGATVAIVEHDFWLKEKTSPTFALGREIETRYKAPEGTTLRMVQHIYQDDTAGRPGGVHFIYLDETKTCTYGEGSQGTCRRETYAYDIYGNRTHVQEYNETGVLYRKTIKTYTVNTSAWIVDRVSREEVQDAGGTVRARRDYFYNRDGNGNLTEGMSATGDLLGVRGYSVIGWAYAETQYWYDAWGNRMKVRDPNNREATTGYDGAMHALPTTQTNAAGHLTRWYYYGVNGTSPVPSGGFFGQLEREVDPNGAETKYRYDPFGRLTKVIRPGDNDNSPAVMYVYYDNSLEPATPTLLGVWRKHDPDTPSAWSYDADGDGVVDGVWERRFYDGLGRLIQVQTPYQDWGGGGQQHDVVRFITYDARGLQASESAPYLKVAYHYNPGECGDKTCNPYVAPDLNRPQTRYGYDALGRTTAITSPDGTTRTTWYNGWQRAEIDANGHMNVYREDAFGRLTTVKEFTGTHSTPIWDDQHSLLYATTTYAYDVQDNLTDVWDVAGNHTRMEYDALGRKVEMTDPDMGAWYYEYDAAGNLIRQTDARTVILPVPPYVVYKTICFYYDALNRLKGKVYTEVANPAGDHCPADPGYSGYAVKFYYDEPGHGSSIGWRTRSETTGSDATTASFTYDLRGRVTQETRTINGAGSFTTTYSYCADDQVQTITYPDGEVITTTYTAQGLPDTLMGTLAGQFTNYPYVSASSYNAAGQPKRFDLGNGLAERFGYFGYRHFGMGDDLDNNAYPGWGAWAFGRLMQHCLGPAGGACPLEASGPALMNWSYWYDGVGNVTATRDFKNADQIQQLRYDALDRLTTAWTEPAGVGAGAYVTRTYEYNAIGNITRFEGATYGYQDGKPHAVTHVNGVQRYWYDQAGNMASRDGATLTWDAENRLVSINQDGRVTTFVYDADGRRVKKVTPWGTTYYIGEHYEKYVPAAGLSILPGDVNADCRVSAVDVQLIAARWGQAWSAQHDVDQDGSAIDAGDIQTAAANWPTGVPGPCTSAVVKYYRLGGRLVALRQNGLLRYVHTDHLGSVSLLTDASGKVVPGSEQRFMPFGKVRAGQPVILPTVRNFTGQPLDFNTGLLYYGARYYDPALGRWTQPDTIVPNPGTPQDLNRYSYVRNSPLRYIDPTGYCIPGVDCPGNRYQDEPQIAPPPPHYDFTDNQWNAVATWSDYFGLPTEFTAAVVAAEVLYDTNWYDRPMDMAIESIAWTGILFTLDSQKFYSYWWAEAFLERSQAGLPFLGGLTFGPGIGQVHAATAIQAEQHFGENFPIRPETASMRHLLLVQDETNIMYVAAILRMHADQRPGSRDASGQMSVDEMGAVFANYHEDVRTAFGSQQAYEAGASPTASGQRWVDQLRPLIWYYRIHGR